MTNYVGLLNELNVKRVVPGYIIPDFNMRKIEKGLINVDQGMIVEKPGIRYEEGLSVDKLKETPTLELKSLSVYVPLDDKEIEFFLDLETQEFGPWNNEIGYDLADSGKTEEIKAVTEKYNLIWKDYFLNTGNL